MDNAMRKTKIICTLGPSTNTEEMLKKLILAGMDAARFNFSHGDHTSHKAMFDMLVKLRTQLNRPIPAILDTRGPEIRVKKFKAWQGTAFGRPAVHPHHPRDRGRQTAVSITYDKLCRDIRPGSTVLIDDGLIEMEVERINGNDIICRVKNGGPVSDNKGINVPGTQLSMPYLNEHDRQDIIFGIETGFDYIAALVRAQCRRRASNTQDS
jgi:pyruvate kinase